VLCHLLYRLYIAGYLSPDSSAVHQVPLQCLYNMEVGLLGNPKNGFRGDCLEGFVSYRMYYANYAACIFRFILDEKVSLLRIFGWRRTIGFMGHIRFLHKGVLPKRVLSLLLAT